MLPTFFFLVWLWPDTISLPKDPFVWKWRKSISFPQRELKCFRSGGCSFIRKVLNGLKWEGQEIEWRFCISVLRMDTLRVTEWRWLSLHQLRYYCCIGLKIKQCNNQSIWYGPKGCLYFIWNNRNMTPRTNHREYNTSHNAVFTHFKIPILWRETYACNYGLWLLENILTLIY